MVKTLGYWVAALGSSILLLKFLVAFLQPRMTFHPSQEITRTPEDLGIPFQEIRVTTRDGETIQGWYMPNPRAQAEIVFFHGNAGNLSSWLDFTAEIFRNDFTVLSLDYRGYGESTGSPTEDGIYKDSEAMVQFFWEELRRPELPVLYFGRSLGGVTAAFSTTVRKPDGLILEATFPDKDSLLVHYPVLRLLGLLSTYQLSTISFLESDSLPVLVIHGDQDQIVPYPVGRELYTLINNPKRFYRVRGAGHNDLHLVGAPEYWDRIRRFCQEIDGPD